MSYASDHEGKCAFVQFLLKPLLLGIDCGIKDVRYLDENDPGTRMYPETVEIINANPEKSKSVNVSGDSNYALVCDVMKKLFGLDYAHEEEAEKLTVKQLVEVLLQEFGKQHVFICDLPDGTTEIDVPDVDYSAAQKIIREAGYEIVSVCDFQGSSWDGFQFIVK